MAVTRDAIVREALDWIGTPFQHAQHCKRHGCDCIGLVIGVFQALKALPAEYSPPGYSQQWHAHKNEELLLTSARAMGFADTTSAPEPGDLLIFKFGRVCSHSGIYLGNDHFVHAYYHLGRVVKQPLRGELSQRLRRVLVAPWIEN